MSPVHEVHIPAEDISWYMALRIGYRSGDGARDDDEIEIYRQGKCSCGKFTMQYAGNIETRFRTHVQFHDYDQTIYDAHQALDAFLTTFASYDGEPPMHVSAYWAHNTSSEASEGA